MANFIFGSHGSTTCFAALVTTFQIPGSETRVHGHVTIGVNKSATADEAAEMEQELREIVDAALPFDLVVTERRTIGIKTHRPALICEAVDPVIGTILSSFYKRHSKRAKNGCPLAFSDLTMHITLEEEDDVVLGDDSAAAAATTVPGTRITVTETVFVARNDCADASTVYTDREWTCLRCDTRNPLEQKQCTGMRLGRRCLQWRPKALIERAHKKREGDWQCCGEYQYASRIECRKCGRRQHDKENKKRSMCK